MSRGRIVVVVLAATFFAFPIEGRAKLANDSGSASGAPPLTEATPLPGPPSAMAPMPSTGAIALTVVDSCSTTVLGDDNCDYDDDDNRAYFANALRQALAAKGFVVVPDGESADRALVVTVTGVGDNSADPTGLICGDLCDMAADATASANYVVKTAGGATIASGSQNSRADDTEPGLQKLADQIAAALTSSAPATPAGSGSAGPAPGKDAPPVAAPADSK